MEAPAVPSFRVDFLNQFARNEKTLKVCQRSIVVGAAESAEVAVEIAKARFAELEGIADWRIHAAAIEVVPLQEQVRTEGRKAAGSPRAKTLRGKGQRAASSGRKL
jgi:hypothetical protein